MSARRYTRRTKLSKSAERPKIVTPRANVSITGDGDPTAPPTATSTPKAPATPAAATGHSTMGAGEQMNPSTVKRRSTSATPARRRASATPSRKRGRALAFNEENIQEPEVNVTQSASRASPRNTANAGASDDPDVERFAGVFQKLLKSAKVTTPSFREADTEDLTEELLRRMRETEQWTTEERQLQKRIRGLEAFDALCDAAKEIRSRAAPVPLASLPPRGSQAEAAAARISATALAEKAPPATTSQSVLMTNEPRPGCSHERLPPRSSPTEVEADGRRDEYYDSARLPVPTFDGKNWAAFKSVFESVAKHYKWSDTIKALRLKCCIKGEARAALGVVESIDWNYDQLVEHMELRHGRNKSRTEVMNELDQLYRKPGQTITQWRDEVIGVANTGNLTEAQRQKYTHYSFLKGLRTFGQMQSWVGEHDQTETLASCYEWAKRYEREVGIPTYTGPPVAPARAPVKVAAHTSAPQTVAVEMVTTSDAATSAQVATHQSEAAPANNIADTLAGLQHKLKKLEKATYNRRGGRGGRGRGRGQGQGWKFGSGNRENQNHSDGTQLSSQSGEQQKQE